MDFVFLLDRSGSLGLGGWDDEKDFVKEVVKLLPISDDQTNVCVVDYTTEGTDPDTFKFRYGHKFSDPQTNTSVLYNIDNNMDAGSMAYTPTGMGLKATLEEAIGHHRPDVMKVLVLLSDGNPSCDNDYGTYDTEPDMANVWAQKVKDAGILLVVVGFGSAPKYVEDWSSSNSLTGEHYFYDASTSSEINVFAPAIGNLSCVDIYSLDPSIAFCNETEVIVSAWGVGFRGNSYGDPKCRFYDKEDGIAVGVVDGEVVSANHFKCVLDDERILKRKGNYFVDVSFNGIHFTHAKRSFQIECDEGFSLSLSFSIAVLFVMIVVLL